MPVRPPSLGAILAFDAAARTGSFTRAATELNLSPSAVSHAVRGLEARLGQALFERRGRRVALTAGGRAFAARVRLGMALLVDAFEPSSGERTETLVVSALPAIAANILTPRLGAFRASFPDVAIDLIVTEALEDFADGRVDVALRFGPGDWAGLQSRVVGSEALAPMCSPAYRDGDMPRSPDALLQCELIRHPESSWWRWLDLWGLGGARVRSWLQIGDAALALDAAARGHGVVLGRLRLAEEHLRTGQLVRLFDDAAVPAEYGYACVWGPRPTKPKLIDAFVDWMAGQFDRPTDDSF